MAKPKLKWCRENVDNYEDMFLIPTGVDGVDGEGFFEDGDLAIDKAAAFIKIGYSSCRFYNGRGGEGTSRPDGYAAYVRDGGKDRLLVEGANTQLRLSGIFSDRYTWSFARLRAAKKAISNELDLLALTGLNTPVPAHGGTWKSTDELPDELCMDSDTKGNT